MTGLVLGATPESLTVNFVAGTDAYFGIDFTDDTGAPITWGDSDTLTLVFNDTAATAWPATLTTGGHADWAQDHATVAALVANLPTTNSNKRVQIIYTSGTFDAVWFAGRVVVR